MILLFLAALFVKHFIADFLYQPPYQWQNKGTYGHLGGIAHTAQHIGLSAVILALFGAPPAWLLGLVIFEAIVHYHMDWFKMNLNARKGWKCNTHNEFWILTGFDQLVHALTYLVMAIWLV